MRASSLSVFWPVNPQTRHIDTENARALEVTACVPAYARILLPLSEGLPVDCRLFASPNNGSCDLCLLPVPAERALTQIEKRVENRRCNRMGSANWSKSTRTPSQDGQRKRAYARKHAENSRARTFSVSVCSVLLLSGQIPIATML